MVLRSQAYNQIGRGNVAPIGRLEYRTAAYFRDHVINLRFHFSERGKVSLVVKSHVCVKMEQEAWWLQQKTVFLGSKYNLN